MKNYIRLIPLTGFATAIALGSSLNAGESTPKGTSMKDSQRHSEFSARDANKNNQTDSRPITASELLGMNINDADNEQVGEIEEIFIDSTTGEVLGMVVSTGGFLGMGEEQSLISPKDLRVDADRTYLKTSISKDQMKKAQKYEKGETAGLGHKAAYRPTTGDDRTERMNPVKGEQSDRLGLAVSEFIGMTVKNRQGESVGDVEEVFLNLETREVVGVVVSTGGFLGMGDRKTLFGMRELSFDREHENVVLDYNRDQIGEIAEFKTDDQSVFEELGDRLDRLGTRVGNYISGDDDADTEGRYAGRSSDMTVFDQGNSSDEIAMTASIRTAIRQNEALSSRANNVTIITNKGKVVLRGEVDSASEKTTLESIAHKKAGRQNVTSELIVAVR